MRISTPLVATGLDLEPAEVAGAAVDMSSTALCVAACCSMLQSAAVCCSRCSVLQCVAVCCSVLQCVAVCCSSV